MGRSPSMVFLLLPILLLLTGCGGDRDVQHGSIADPEVAAAYARLHGAVRWFHPADEAA